MGIKYIKDKTGKFQGSVSDGSSVPASVKKIPSKAASDSRDDERSYRRGNKPSFPVEQIEAFYEKLEAQRAAERRLRLIEESYLQGFEDYPDDAVEDFTEEGFCGSYDSREVKTYGAAYMLNEESGEFEASVSSHWFGNPVDIAEKNFTSEKEAQAWCMNELNRSTKLLRKFRDLYTKDHDGLTTSIEKTLEARGLGDLVDADLKRAFQSDEGMTVADANIKIDYRRYPFGPGVHVEKTVDGETLRFEFYNADPDKCVLFGLFAAVHE